MALKIDLKNTISQGIIIPTKNGNKDSFRIKFQLSNESDKPKSYCYKVYFQNESYRHQLLLNNRNGNPKAASNFYGSWIGDNSGFDVTGIIPPESGIVEITDTFCIQGNPRNEKQFFGGKPEPKRIEQEKITNLVNHIKSSPEWVKKIEIKAKKNSVSLDKQIHLDAIWNIQHDKEQGNLNNRWKRNPRLGDYSFLLVCMEQQHLDSIPVHIQDVSLKDTITGNYVNPFHHFLHVQKSPKIQTLLADKKLNVSINYELQNGIYLGANSTVSQYQNQFKNSNDSMFYHAPLEQYFHSVEKKHYFNNIPLHDDVVNGQYTRDKYTQNANKKFKEGLIKDYIKNNAVPGKTVGYDTLRKAVYMKNLGYTNSGNNSKENVGVKARQGLTYGKYTAQIYFPKIISPDFVWNGITCAFWLKFQSGDWNKRSNCNSGYRSKLNEDQSQKTSSVYSEIDIEIVKTSKYWPATSYDIFDSIPIDSALNQNLIFSCTNWDLACHDPKKFNIGVRKIKHKDKEFKLHRWDDSYRAITSKFEFNQDSAMGRLYYYQIEWQPDYIVWRMGPSKDKLMVIGYMDNSSTMIPDYQMEMVITQEFHLAQWWPLSPFKQGDDSLS